MHLIGDCHFNDPNIIKFEGRPFKSTAEMDEFMIQEWNATVPPDGDIIVAGDFICSNDFQYIRSIISRLNGKISLVRGNHDTNLNMLEDLGVKIYHYPIVVDDFWMISHEPMYVNMSMPYANIYAHIHTNPNYKDVSPRGICVSTERLGYRPIFMDDAKARVLACN